MSRRTAERSPSHAIEQRIAELVEQPSWRQRLEGLDVVYGRGSLARLGELAGELGATRALVVTDRGIARAGHVERAVASLAASAVEVSLFDRVDENPTSETVDHGVAAVRDLDVDLVVGLGGGSAMDAAKGINLVLTNGGRIADYEGFDRAERPLLPAIGVPTTAGTGSEAQSYALISEAVSHRKMACGDPDLRFHTVLLDPELLATVPAATRAASGLDAVSHAVESFVTTRRTEASAALAKTAWELLDRHLDSELAAAGPGSNEATTRGALQLAAFLAGAAIERSMLGAAHACANPLTARYGTTHGAAVALLLPAVIRFNATVAEERYAQLVGGPAPSPDGAERLARRVEALRRAGGLPERLAEVGVERAHLEELAAAAAEQWTLRFNPRPATRDDLRELYAAAL